MSVAHWHLHCTARVAVKAVCLFVQPWLPARPAESNQQPPVSITTTRREGRRRRKHMRSHTCARSRATSVSRWASSARSTSSWQRCPSTTGTNTPKLHVAPSSSRRRTDTDTDRRNVHRCCDAAMVRGFLIICCVALCCVVVLVVLALPPSFLTAAERSGRSCLRVVVWFVSVEWCV